MPPAFKALSFLLLPPLLPGHARCLEGTSSLDLVKEKNYDLFGQTIVMTGGDSGIGSAMALSLAAANAKVIFLGHNMEKTAEWMKHITHVTGNEKLSAIAIDQFSLSSVKDAADAVLAATDRIDVFIGDAGSDLDRDVEGTTTEDGYESDFQLQYLSHFYLVELLLPTLRRSQGRVVYTAAAQLNPVTLCPIVGLPMGCEALEGLENVVRNDVNALMLSFFMKAMHARHIAFHEKDVMAFSFNPGAVYTPGMRGEGKKGMRGNCKGEPAPDDMPFEIRWMTKYRQYDTCLCGTNVSCPLNDFQGAVSAVYFAAAPRQELQPINGVLTVQCGWNAPGLDPFDGMVSKNGYDATMAYMEQLQTLSWAWVKRTGIMKARRAEAFLETEVDSAFPKVVAVMLVGAFLGFFVFWAKARTAAPSRCEAEYMHLAGAY